ncbi:MAG TPA: fumarylacetoacetate hydrolase family protein, partial [Candidatus Limnocylindrales bacterium]|nr:fumarylacetoacetate hydrolase family protein [Candidatus Limnocylindrales bacterium]
MKVAHVRERNGPAGDPWRLAAALDPADEPRGWIDLEVARRRLARRDPELAHNDPLFRQPLTTLDDLLARGLRVEHLRAIVDAIGPVDPGASGDDDAVLAAADLAFGPPVLRPPGFRDFYAFERHVATMWARRGSEVPEAWYRLPIFYFSNTSEIRGTDEPVWAPRGSAELDYEVEVAAIVDTPIVDTSAEDGEAAIGGYTILADWSARDLQRDETTVRLGPAKGKDFAASIGPWLVTPDELADARAGKGYALAMTATVSGTETTRGTWADVHFSFGEMLARASADVRVRAAEIVGSGTVGGGSLLEIREETIGRYLEPGDEVVISVERLGRLRTPIT